MVIVEYSFRRTGWLVSGHVSDINSSPNGQDGRRFADDKFKCNFMNENICIMINISPKFVPTSPIDNNQALVQIMA